MSEPAGDGAPAGDGWSAVIEDMEATAAEYRERGWTALELHPGDSVLVDSDRRTGLDVVLPGPEFESFVMGMIPHVTVHEPASLRESLQERVGAWLEDDSAQETGV